MNGLRDLIVQVVREVVGGQERSDSGPAWTQRRAVISAVHLSDSPRTVDVTIAGGTVPGLRFTGVSTPAVGDACWVQMRGASALYVVVLG